MKLHGHPLSGNAYKVKLLLSLMGLEFDWVEVDVMKGAHKRPEFLAINPFGQIPVLEDGDRILLDAQAILVYLVQMYGDRASLSALKLPEDPAATAEVMRWLFTTASEIRQGPEAARLYHLFKVKAINIERATQKSAFILEQMEQHLGDRHWLACDHVTLADIAAFPYVALAPDGQVSLDPYPNVLTWIERIKALPGFVPMRGIAVSESFAAATNDL